MAHKGGRFVGTLSQGNSAVVLTRKFYVTNGVTITKGDFVYLASGLLTNSSIAAKKLVGCANSTIVGDGTSKLANACEVIINPQALYLIDNDNLVTTFASTHVGTYFDLIGATGAQLVDTSTTTTTGELVCVEYNPQYPPYETTTTMGLFMIAKPFFDGLAA